MAFVKRWNYEVVSCGSRFLCVYLCLFVFGMLIVLCVSLSYFYEKIK
jgi:hypothetical protein